MRREGHIIEEIVEYSNMAESFDQVSVAPNGRKAIRGVTCSRIVRRSSRNSLNVLLPARSM